MTMKKEEKKRGQPLKFQSVQKLQEKIEQYFDACDNRKVPETFDNNGNPKTYKPSPRPYTITGLALFLDTSRETLMNYEKKEAYFDTVKKAKLKCHNWAEEQLHTGRQAAGTIFSLKNNYGWEDKKKIDHTTDGEKITRNLSELDDSELNDALQRRLSERTKKE